MKAMKAMKGDDYSSDWPGRDRPPRDWTYTPPSPTWAAAPRKPSGRAWAAAPRKPSGRAWAARSSKRELPGDLSSQIRLVPQEKCKAKCKKDFPVDEHNTKNLNARTSCLVDCSREEWDWNKKDERTPATYQADKETSRMTRVELNRYHNKDKTQKTRFKLRKKPNNKKDKRQKTRKSRRQKK